MGERKGESERETQQCVSIHNYVSCASVCLFVFVFVFAYVCAREPSM